MMEGDPNPPLNPASITRLTVMETCTTPAGDSSAVMITEASKTEFLESSAEADAGTRVVPGQNGVEKDENIGNNSGIGGLGLGLSLCRVSIPQEVFEKIKERITYSREREKQSLAKQILRKEEEKRKLARERDADDLESKIRVLRENINAEKAKRQRLYNQLKSKMATEELLKKQKQMERLQQHQQAGLAYGAPGIMSRDRAGSASGLAGSMGGRGPGDQPMHHSYPSSHMLISQTNPLMRPRLLSYPVQVPVSVSMSSQQPQSHHLELPVPNSGGGHKRQRSVSPSAENQRLSNQSGGSSRSHHSGNQMLHASPNPSSQQPQYHPGKPPSRSMHPMEGSHSPQPGRVVVGGGQVSQPQNPGSSSGKSSQQSTPHKQPSTPSSNAPGPSPVGLPMNLHASPYGNQVLCIVPPNMMQGGHGVMQMQMPMGGMVPVSAAHFLPPGAQKQGGPEGHVLSPQQQQQLLAQQMHALGPEYIRALQQAALMAENQQRERVAVNAADMYRHYAAAGLLQAQAAQQAAQAQQARSQPAASPHAEALQAGAASPQQRMAVGGGGIVSGMPVYGPGGMGSSTPSSASSQR